MPTHRPLPPHLQSSRCTPQQQEQGARFVAEWTARRERVAFWAAPPAPAAPPARPMPSTPFARPTPPAPSEPSAPPSTSADVAERAERHREWHRYWETEKAAAKQKEREVVAKYARNGLAAKCNEAREASNAKRFLETFPVRPRTSASPPRD